MKDRQVALLEAAVDHLMPHVQGLSREQIGEVLFKLVLDCRSPPPLNAHEPVRRTPVAGEVLPPHQHAMWARGVTKYD